MNIKLYIILQCEILWISFVELSFCGMGGPAERVSQVSTEASSNETHRRGVSPRQSMATRGLFAPKPILHAESWRHKFRSMTAADSRAVGREPMVALDVTAHMSKAAEGLRAASTRSMATPSLNAPSNGPKVSASLRSASNGSKVAPRAASKRTIRIPSAVARRHYYKRMQAQLENMVDGLGAPKNKQKQEGGGKETVPPPDRPVATGTVPGRPDATVGGRTKKKRTTVGNGTTAKNTKDSGLVIGGKKPGDEAKYRYTFPDSNRRRTRKRARITASRISFKNNCDYLIYYCLKAYNTGTLCGRTAYYKYKTFKNYCVMDYVNCMERYELWIVARMGACIEDFTELGWYEPYPYMDDYFMDQMYVLEF